MKNTIKIAFAIVFCLMLGVTVNAQASIDSGTVDFSVTVAPSFDIRSNGAGTGLNGMAVAVGIANSALSATVTVADASPNIDSSLLTASVPIRLRSNAPYKLNASRTGTSVPSGPNFESSDIGMSITYNARGAGLVNTGGVDNVVAFGGNVGALAPAAVEIANGARISNGGDNSTPNNFITANLNFNAQRAYYTPTVSPYQDQITVSILAP
ncbi:MAG: hypothetical protein LH614_03250 [Pyrinomonadaceae bacterium]|nr:hypothetical protein [Pyrinomonadaceae bacterium]